jgi:hypothetical protein
MRKEFFNLETFDTIEATQAALDDWVLLGPWGRHFRTH